LPLRNSDGAVNVTLSPGSGFVGRYAPDGSVYVTLAPGGSFVGQCAPDGSLYITEYSSGYGGAYAPDGSRYVTQDASIKNGSLYIYGTISSGVPSTALAWGTDGILWGTDYLLFG
jgi:hypothetical protein